VKLLAALGVCSLALAACDAAKPPRRDKSDRGRATSTTSSAASVPGVVTPVLEDGDIIFHESTSRQSEMVRALTRSRWTHVGVVFVESGNVMVFEAVSPVRRTPLVDWIRRGKDGHYVVKRLRDSKSRLTPGVAAKMRALGKSWLGRPYDAKFRWDDEALYCSELVYKLFERGAGLELGTIERASDMNLDDERVKRALDKRFARGGFDPAEPVVTPDSIFNDDDLVEVER
jgi:hypothetical protein